MKQKDKKMIISAIVEAMKQNAVKDFHNGILSFAWTDKKTNQYSVYLTAENIFKALMIEELMDGKLKTQEPK